MLLVLLLMDVTYAYLHPHIWYQPVVCLTACGVIAAEVFYARARTASPTAPGSASSRPAQSRPSGWCHALYLATVSSHGALGGGNGAAEARQYPARAWV